MTRFQFRIQQFEQGIYTCLFNSSGFKKFGFNDDAPASISAKITGSHWKCKSRVPELLNIKADQVPAAAMIF